MSDKLNFEIPNRNKKSPELLPVVMILLVLLVIIGITNIVLMFTVPGGKGSSGGSGVLGAAAQKELALKLQKRSLYDGAVKAWIAYMDEAALSTKEKAEIWYSIGKLYQEAGNYEQALVSFYTSESIMKIKELEQDIGRKISECLESLGKFAALRYELSERVGIDDQKKSGDVVVAEIGTEKITMADLDRKIEQFIELVISQYAAYMDEETLNRQKEELFKQYSGEEGKLKLLNQYIVEEILYRKAREEQLADDPKTRAMLEAVQKQILSQQLLTKKLADQIRITEGDVKNYYEANKAKYIENGVQKSYEQVRSQVYQELRSQKENEVQQAYIEELRKSFNVVLYPSKLKTSGGKADGK